MPTPLLTIADAGINLGDRWLLRHADVTVHAGGRLGLVGRNGAGKSSLMKLMAGRTENVQDGLVVHEDLRYKQTHPTMFRIHSSGTTKS